MSTPKKMSVRSATMEDMRDIWEWRNDPQTRNASISQEEIPLKDHAIWYEKAIHSPEKEFYVAENEALKIGMIRFDLINSSYEWYVSINLNPQARGMGYGYQLLSKSLYLLKQKNSAAIFKAEMEHNNIASQKIFAKCGFEISQGNVSNPGFITMVLNK